LAPENTKSIKAKHAPSDARTSNEPKSKEEEKFFSPRKLLKEYDEEKPKKKARTKLNYDSTSSSSTGQQEEKHEEEDTSASASEDANDELFSPALKPPRASRSTSASPPNGRVRLETNFATTAQSDEAMDEEEAVADEMVHTVETVDAGEHEDEDATAPEQEFNPYVATDRLWLKPRCGY
jgi:hypothetical protein